MYIEDVMDLQDKYGWDAKVVACCIVIKDEEGKMHSYSLNKNGSLEEVT